VNIAVIGLGFMGSTHLKALKNVPAAKLAAVVSGDPVKLNGDLSSIQGNLGGPGERYDFSQIKRYTRTEEALADPEIEAVDLCLPTHLHAPVTIAALRAGKHVLVEKPMALNGAEARQMIDEARKANRILMTGQVLRFFPMYTTLIDLLGSGELGQVRAALFRRRCAAPSWGKWLLERNEGGGGVFDLLIHDVDMCLRLFGKPRSVTATGYEDLAGGIDFVNAQFHYPDIGSVVVTGGWHHPKAYPFSMEYTVSADGGTIEYSSAGRPPTLYGKDGTERALPQPEVDGYQAQLAYFIECASSGRQPELCDPQESADAVELTRMISEARRMRGAAVAV
jgi:predicted dehydrogenase